MPNPGVRSVLSAIKTTLPSQPARSTEVSMPAMRRLAQARLPSQQAIPISTLPATQNPVEGKRSIPALAPALQRIASARLGTAAFPQPQVPKDTTPSDEEDSNALDAVADARPSFQMGCKPVRDTEVDSLRQKVQGQLRDLKNDLGRGNEKLPDAVSLPTEEVAQEVENAEREVATLRL